MVLVMKISSSSPILASQELPKEWKSLDKSKVRQGERVLQTASWRRFDGNKPLSITTCVGEF